MFDEPSVPHDASFARPTPGKVTGRIHWALRAAVAAEFIGHGAFGIITKAAWVPYFAVAGIPEAWAWRLMPVIGLVDISLGLLALVRPTRVALLYMAFWGFFTAFLRPLAGEGIWEFLERAGNFGVPFALLVLSAPRASLGSWFSRIEVPEIPPVRGVVLARILRLTTGLLLIGHGGFGAIMGKNWVPYFKSLGIAPGVVDSLNLTAMVGWFEIALGLVVLASRGPGLLAFVLAWKLGTEWLRPMSGEPVWEFVERFGSFAAPLALLFLTQRPRRRESWRLPKVLRPLWNRELLEQPAVQPPKVA